LEVLSSIGTSVNPAVAQQPDGSRYGLVCAIVGYGRFEILREKNAMQIHMDIAA
jgi:hypothetical protein